MSKLLLQMSNVKYTIGLRTLLDIDRFEVRDFERIGLVGENGAGKTTLLRLIQGELMPDSGAIARHCPVALVRQMDAGPEEFAFDPRLEAEFDAQQAREGLSGGERTRRRIAGALSAGSPLLLCDEPTSDLDAEGVKLLTKRLRQHDGALILISHDRALLDALCTTIAELEDGHLTLYPGNYSAYREQKSERRERQQFEYEQYRGEQARLRASIQGKKESASQVLKTPKRMGNSEARLHKRSSTEVEQKLHQQRSALSSRLEQLEEKKRPREDVSIKIQMGAFAPITSKLALEISGMTIRFPDRALLENAGMRLPTGSRTALIGENGCGKTTLIKRICAGGDEAHVRINPGVKIGLFGQDHADSLDLGKTSLENAMRDAVYRESDVRTVLARLNLRGDDVFKPAGVLSGGERAKVALCKLFVSDVNLLILDEPTNHLDVFTLEALESVLSEYRGTLLLVSHDRKFVESVATRLVFFGDLKLQTHECGLAEYEARSQTDASADQRRQQIDRMALEMRMAFVASRIANPGKRDDRARLEDEYQSLAKQLQQARV